MASNKSKYFKSKVITLAKQVKRIKDTYDEFSTTITTNSELIIIGKLKPTPMSRQYTIKISYKLGNKPLIEVINPKLKEMKGKIPHTYSENRLCLYYPKYDEWSKYDYISDTIIPWTSTWLYYYEIWNVTGEWLGGGIHPDI